MKMNQLQHLSHEETAWGEVPEKVVVGLAQIHESAEFKKSMSVKRTLHMYLESN
jgi:hypothetical protein